VFELELLRDPPEGGGGPQAHCGVDVVGRSAE
jgi:hypothetical protein